MRIIISILTFLFQIGTFAQGAYYYQHLKPFNNEIFDVAEGDNGFLTVGRSSGGDGNGGFLLYIGIDGNVKWEKNVNLEYLSIDAFDYRSITYQSPYFYTIGRAGINNERKYLLSKIDEQGNIQYSEIIDTPFQLGNDNLPSKIISDKNSLFIAGSGITDFGTKGELLKLDLDGNIVWKNKYSQYPNSTQYSEYLLDIKKTNDNSYLLELYSDAFSSYDISTIIKINNNGDEIWRKSYDTIIPTNLTSDSLGFISAAPYKDSHVIALFNVTNEDQYNPITYPRRDFALIEYDEYGQEIGYKRFYNPAALASSNIQVNTKNEVFILSSSEYGETEGYHLGVIKLNSELEIEWSNFYKKDNPFAELPEAGPLFNNGHLTKDGGFILSAQDFYFEFGSHYYNSTLLKLDCIGDTVWNSNSCLSPEFSDVTLFPNPSINNFTIQIPSLPEYSEIILKIYDVSGKLVKEFSFKDKNVINVNTIEWAKGVYNCVIFINGQYLNTKKIIKK